MKTTSAPVNRAELVERVAKMDNELGLEDVRAAIDAIEGIGMGRPVEEFVHVVLERYEQGKLTPDCAMELVKDFRCDFDYLVESSTYFVRQNPDRFRELCAEVVASPAAALAKVAL